MKLTTKVGKRVKFRAPKDVKKNGGKAMSGLWKRVAITLGAFAAILVAGLLITYQVIRINWNSFMEIQPSFRPMDHPLPVPAQSVPVEGPAYIPYFSIIPFLSRPRMPYFAPTFLNASSAFFSIGMS